MTVEVLAETVHTLSR